MLCDLCRPVVGSVNQPADMTRPLSLITHFSLLGCQRGLGRGGRIRGSWMWRWHVVLPLMFELNLQ